jgi:hypothetical protein
MTTTRLVSLLVFTPLIVGSSPVALADSPIVGAPPATFNVRVTVQNLLPEIVKLRVRCNLDRREASGGDTLALGVVEEPVTNGGFDGVVTVPINRLLGDYTIASLTQANSYACNLMLVRQGGLASTPGGGSPEFDSKPDTPLIFNIEGPYPAVASGGQ